MTPGRLVVAFVCATTLAGPLFAAKVEHTKIVEPKSAMAAPAELQALGQPTRFLVRGDSMYVAGTQGIALLSPDGKVAWSTALEPMGVREIAVDDAGIAYTGFEVAGIKGSFWSFFGNTPGKLTFAPSVVGLLGPDGSKTWQVAGPASRISAPCLTPGALGVLTGAAFHIYSRADGQLKIADSDLEPAALPNDYAVRMFRPQPLFLDNAFVGGYYYNFYRISPSGEELARENKGKTNVVAGPLLFHGNMLIGSYSTAPDLSQAVNKGLVTQVEPTGEFKKVWREDISDDHSATGDIVLDGDTIYASSNFTVTALDSKGKKIWDAEGKDGALSNGSMRGVRFVKSFGYRYWGGQLMVVHGDHLYLSTRREIAKKTWADVITVLNKKDGTYVKTIDLKKEIVDMAVWDGRLALATADGVMFLTLD